MLQSWRRLAATVPPRWSRGIADARPLREGDLVLLRRTDDRSAPPILSRPLKPGRRIEGHRGVVRHDDILGKRVRDVVLTLPKRQRSGDERNATRRKEQDQQQYRLHEVKLEEYVRLSKRLVTPLYPQDARLIVDLLDLHPHALLHEPAAEKLEILEAGTGHGALTLHIARAICGANGALPRDSDAQALSTWKASRKAVVHTIDVSARYSEHAEGVVQGFRNGLYSPHIDFHVGDVADWAAAALAERKGSPFLSHAFLDLPGAEAKVSAVTDALRVDGTLILFNPSITQIMDAAKKVKDQGIELDLEKVVELGVNGGSGGREWDVRPVKPRAAVKASEVVANGDGEDEGSEADEDIAAPLAASDGAPQTGWNMVCRPKVGERIVGGGFLGVWRKRRTST